MNRAMLRFVLLFASVITLLWLLAGALTADTLHRSPATDSVVYPATEDTYVISGHPDTSFGQTNALWTGYDPNTSILEGRILVKFAPDGLADKVRQGTVGLVSASLELYLQRSEGDGAAMRIEAVRTVSPWSESTTWNQHLNVSTAPAPTASATVGAAQGTYTWDVTSLVQDWIHANDGSTTIGFRLTGNEGGPRSLRGFWSRNCSDNECAGNRPRLVVQYVNIPPTPTPTPGLSSLAFSSQPAGALVAGDLITYSISLRNGRVPLSNVVVTNTVPSELQVVTGTIGAEALAWQPQVQGRQIGWTLNQVLPANATDLLTYQAVRPTPVPTAVPTSLAVSKSGPEFVTPGGVITYALQVSNYTPYTLTEIAMTDTLPGGLAIVDAGGGAIITATATQILWLAPAPLASGEQLTRTFSARVTTAVDEIVNDNYEVQAMASVSETDMLIAVKGTLAVTTYVTSTIPSEVTPVITNFGACAQWDVSTPSQTSRSQPMCSGPIFNPAWNEWLPAVAR